MIDLVCTILLHSSDSVYVVPCSSPEILILDPLNPCHPDLLAQTHSSCALEAGVFNKFIYADRSTLNSTELYVGLPANSAVEKTNEEDDFKSFISEGKVSLVGTDKLSNIQIQEIPVLAVGLVRARLTVLCFC